MRRTKISRPAKCEPTTVIGVRLDWDEALVVKSKAAVMGVSMAEFVRRALRFHAAEDSRDIRAETIAELTEMRLRLDRILGTEAQHAA